MCKFPLTGYLQIICKIFFALIDSLATGKLNQEPDNFGIVRRFYDSNYDFKHSKKKNVKHINCAVSPDHYTLSLIFKLL